MRSPCGKLGCEYEVGCLDHGCSVRINRRLLAEHRVHKMKIRAEDRAVQRACQVARCLTLGIWAFTAVFSLLFWLLGIDG